MISNGPVYQYFDFLFLIIGDRRPGSVTAIVGIVLLLACQSLVYFIYICVTRIYLVHRLP